MHQTKWKKGITEVAFARYQGSSDSIRKVANSCIFGVPLWKSAELAKRTRFSWGIRLCYDTLRLDASRHICLLAKKSISSGIEEKSRFPVLLFIDGHTSHISLEASEFCHENKIFLYCLLPNATHILQPCAIYKPFRNLWREEANSWLKTNPWAYKM